MAEANEWGWSASFDPIHMKWSLRRASEHGIDRIAGDSKGSSEIRGDDTWRWP